MIKVRVILITLLTGLSSSLAFSEPVQSVREKIALYLEIKKIFQADKDKLENLLQVKEANYIFRDKLESLFYKYLNNTLDKILLYLDWLIETEMLEDMLARGGEDYSFRRLKAFDEIVLETCLYSLELVSSNTESKHLKEISAQIKEDIFNLRDSVLKLDKK